MITEAGHRNCIRPGALCSRELHTVKDLMQSGTVYGQGPYTVGSCMVQDRIQPMP